MIDNENSLNKNDNIDGLKKTLQKQLAMQLNINAPSTNKRRYSETYYKSLLVHKRPRLVKKCGELNILMENVPKHRRRLLRDIFNTILDMRWRWHGIIFMLSFITSWLLFAIVWYLIAFVHNDLDGQVVEIPRKHEQLVEIKKLFLHKSINFMEELMKNYSEINDFGKMLQLKLNETNVVESKHVPCVSGLHDYTSAILYSIETQHTIGYGLRHITEQCSFAIGLFMVQSCFGILIQALFAGVILAKISRPNKRKRTIIFSHNAVVSKRDGKLCFMIKLGNLRMSQLSDARIKMLMIKSRRTNEGEFIPFQSYEMKVGFEGSSNDSVFFPWPKTIEHIIDEDSPFYEYCHQANHIKNSNEPKEPIETTNNERNMSNLRASPTNQPNYEELAVKNEDYEIVVLLEGNIETTGASCHIRTSYLPQEILFGYRFTPVYPKFTNYEYSFDYSEFDQVEPFQYDLMHLNVAYLNRDLNYVFDAQKEEKNYQLTYQNTLPKDYFNQNKRDNKFTALTSIFNAFKTNKSQNNSTNTENSENNKTSEEQEEGSKRDLNDMLSIKNELNAYSKNKTGKTSKINLKSKYNNLKSENAFSNQILLNDEYQATQSTIVVKNVSITSNTSSKIDIKAFANGEIPSVNDVHQQTGHFLSSNTSMKKKTTGRFTIVPVVKKQREDLCRIVRINNSTTKLNIFCPMMSHARQRKSSLGQHKQLEQLRVENEKNMHHRTNSLPPIYSGVEMHSKLEKKISFDHAELSSSGTTASSSNSSSSTSVSFEIGQKEDDTELTN